MKQNTVAIAGHNASVRIGVVMPLFNDWQSAEIVCRALFTAAAERSVDLRVVIVDDGSTESPVSELPWLDEPSLSIVRFDGNRGHQHAVVAGLRWLHERSDSDIVAIMDADGEDPPAELWTLVEALKRTDGIDVVFAKRGTRVAPSTFIVLYSMYRLLYRLLIGGPIDIGHFCAFRAGLLPRILSLPSLQVHFVATVLSTRLRVLRVPVDRAARLDGRSHMSNRRLIRHGLTGISIHQDRWPKRLIAAVAAVILPTAIIVALLSGQSTHAANILSTILLSMSAIGIALSAGLWYILRSLAKSAPVDIDA